MISGQMWNQIRGPPFAHRNPQTGDVVRQNTCATELMYVCMSGHSLHVLYLQYCLVCGVCVCGGGYDLVHQTITLLCDLHTPLLCCVCVLCVPQGYFSGSGQYQFVAETYIVLGLCIHLAAAVTATGVLC